MLTGIQQTYDQRARLVQQMQELTVNAAKEGRAMTQEENDKWTKIEADERALTSTIDAYERTEKLVQERASKHFEATTTVTTQAATWTSDSTASRDDGRKKEYRDSYVQMLRGGMSSLSPEQRALIESRGTSTQVVGTDSLGGYLVPDEWQREIEKSMLDYSGIMQAARIERTSTGKTWFWPTANDTAAKAVLIAEAGSFTVQDVSFGQKQLDSYLYGDVFKVSWQMLRDNEYNLEGELRAFFTDRFGRALNTACTTDDGSSKPNGVVTASTLGKTAASATAFTFNEVIDLIHSVDPAYRASPRFGLMFHDAVLASLKKLSVGSSDARPLWQPSLVAGTPDKIDGYQYWINQDMDSSINASSRLILAGDFSKYVIRIVQDLQYARLDELFSMNGLVGFQAYMSFDGELMNTSAIKHLITAAS